MNLRVDTAERIVLSDYNEKNIPIHQTLIVAKSGVGKSLAGERGTYNYFKKGFIIICVTDVKNLLELGFMGMPTSIMAQYQLNELKRQNIEPQTAKTKIFHPFSFSIPHTKIPETRFFTLPITAMGDSEFRFLIETEEDKTTRELLSSALNSIDKKDSLWDFLLNVEELIKRQIKTEGSYERKMPDKKNFCLSGTSMGSLKNIDEIARIFNRFQQHLFLMPEDCKFNLNIKEELFTNQEEIKIFTTRYIRDQKTKDFVTLILLNQIVEKAESCKYPILIVLDEIKDLVPSAYSRIGYKAVLVRELARHLNTSFRANNIASISTSQSFAGISKNLTKTNAFTETFIGSIEGDVDLLNLKQIYLCEKEVIETILELKYNEFLIRGLKELSLNMQSGNPFKSLFSPFPHREPYMNFDNMFARYYPERMIKYLDLVKEMEALKDSFIEKSWQKKTEKFRKEEEAKEQKKKKEEELAELKQKITELKTEKKESHAEFVKRRNEEIWKLSQEGMKQQELAKKFEISQPMVNLIISKFKKKKEVETSPEDERQAEKYKEEIEGNVEIEKEYVEE